MKRTIKTSKHKTKNQTTIGVRRKFKWAGKYSLQNKKVKLTGRKFLPAPAKTEMARRAAKDRSLSDCSEPSGWRCKVDNLISI
jgi:hypothetical protein